MSRTTDILTLRRAGLPQDAIAVLLSITPQDVHDAVVTETPEPPSASGGPRAVAHAAGVVVNGTFAAKQTVATATLELTEGAVVALGASARFHVAGASAATDVGVGMTFTRPDDGTDFIQGQLDATGWGGAADGDAISDGGPGTPFCIPLAAGTYEVELYVWRQDDGANGGVVTLTDASAIAAAV